MNEVDSNNKNGKHERLTVKNESKNEILNQSMKSNITSKTNDQIIPIHDINSANENNIKTAEKTLLFWKIFVIVFLVVSATTTIYFYSEMKQLFVNFLTFMKSHIFLGTLIIIGIKILGTILYVPGVLLAIATGYGYKQIFNNYLISIPVGTVVYMIGSFLGCSCVFLLSRTLLKDWLHPILSSLKFYRALDRAISKKGYRINLLLRLSPLIPYNIMNYFLGITSTSYPAYLFGLTGFTPLVICYIYMGTTLDDLAEYSLSKESKVLELVILICSIVFSIVCILIITKLAKDELELELANDDIESRKQENDDKKEI